MSPSSTVGRLHTVGKERNMHRSTPVVLSVVAIGIFFAMSAAVRAQDSPRVIHHRVCTILDGKTTEAVAVGQRARDYWREHYPSQNVRVFRSPVLPANKIHFVFQFENMKAWADGFEEWNTNPGVVEILIESRQYLDATTCEDKFYRVLP